VGPPRKPRVLIVAVHGKRLIKPVEAKISLFKRPRVCYYCKDTVNEGYWFDEIGEVVTEDWCCVPCGEEG
jgi:hypothetical protein